jgi:hypothetical protein
MNKRKTFIFILSVFVMMVLTANAWFDPNPPYYGRVIITRANTYETYQKDQDVFNPTNSLEGIDFFDRGDVDADITALYGGDPNNTFNVAWPVTFYFWFQTNAVTAGYAYDEARFQYHEGTNTASSTNWTTIGTITNFPASFFNNQTVHFGFLTWTPPHVTNSHYLVRVWARLENGMQNGDLNATNIDSEGDGNTWDDYEVLLVKVIPYKKPGSRSFTDDSRGFKYVHIETKSDLPAEPIIKKHKKSWLSKIIDWLVFWK